MNDQYIGSLILFAGNFVPHNCMVCDGSILQIGQYPALYSLLSNKYGGNGTTTFALPDFRDKAPLGAGLSYLGTNYPLGTQGGEASVTLLQSQMPIHTHTSAVQPNLMKVDSVTVNAGTDASQAVNTPTGNYWGKAPAISLQEVNAYTDQTNTTMAADAIGQAVLPPLLGTINLSNTGGNLPHENRLPFTTLNWLIVYSGIYPQRD
ncbi:phage tail protein [Flavobacterium rhizosphaerae]|uniref:Tail fiber protein n=1 Tax=Flavobacterium rhizosphaerae TaxID=3163298 RepID=A0ABW8YYT3_9FLAO